MPTPTLLSRTARGLTIGTAALALLLTGCSATSDEEAAGAAAEESTLPAAESTTEYPLTLETAWGDTVLEERPERIATLGSVDIELLAALGVTPVVAPSTIDRAIWAQDALPGEIEVIYDADFDSTLPYEEIAAAEPDLIVVNRTDLTDSFEQLSAIAPVVAAATTEDAATTDWRTEIAGIGEALDLADAAQQVTDDYDAFFAQAKADNPEFAGLTATYIVQYSEEYGTSYSSVPGSDIEEVFLDLGFVSNPRGEQFVEDNAVSAELVSEIDADVLLISNNTGDEAELERLLTGSELFQSLEAVQSGHWTWFDNVDPGYVYDGEQHEGNIAWALAHGGGPLGKQWAADQLIVFLQDALA